MMRELLRLRFGIEELTLKIIYNKNKGKGIALKYKYIKDVKDIVIVNNKLYKI